MVKRNKYLTSVLFITASVLGQTNTSNSDKFLPSGKPIVTVYSDFVNTNSGGNSDYAFEITRAYFGYGYEFSNKLSGKIVFDVANKSGLSPSSFTAFLKNAYVEYNDNNFKTNFGLISGIMFKLQESIWGKRYLYKSFQDEYGFGSSADLGMSVSYSVLPQLNIDVAIYNGEGYKKVQSDSVLQFAAGLTVQPIKNFYTRVYIDYMKRNEAQTSFNAMLGYKSKKISAALEYNLQHGNMMLANKNWSGISAYATVPFADKFAGFARFDNLSSNKIGGATNGWNATDGQVYIIGVEYFPIKGIQITPNFRYNDLASGKTKTSIYLNIGMNL